MKPDDIVQSSLKAVQTVTENLSKELEYVQDAIRRYSGAVSSVGNPVQDMKELIGKAACQIAKYMKVVFDKIMNYVMETLNAGMTAVVASTPSSMRYQVSDLKETVGELTLCMYGKITNTLCGSIEGLLNDLFNPDKLKKQAEDDALNPNAEDGNTYTSVPACAAEDMMGTILAIHKDAINDANNNLIDNINSFIDDLQSQLSGVSGGIGDIMTKMGGINGSMTSALGFANIKLNVFGCELKPAASMSDYYSLCTGGAGAPQQSMPSNKSVENKTSTSTPENKATPDTNFMEPTKGQTEVDMTQNTESNTDEEWLSEDLTSQQREDIMNDPNIDIG